MNEKPKRCIDAVLKRCASCPYGVIDYPDWVETYEDLSGCCYDTRCMAMKTIYRHLKKKKHLLIL